MKWNVICDFDGTISIPDTTDLLLHHFADARWHEIETEWEQGVIGTAECMRRQIELLCCSKEDLDALIATISIDPAFPAFLELCREYGLPIAIASDGLDYVIHSVLLRYGLDDIPVTANRLVFEEEGRYHLNSPYVASTCFSGSGVCKCQVAKGMTNNNGAGILYVGDGRSDFCVSLEQADLVLAKASLLKYCLVRNIEHQAIAGFGDATVILQSLLEKESLGAVTALSVEGEKVK